LLLQTSARPGEPVPYPVDRDAQDLSNLFVWVTFQVVQHHHLALLNREPVDDRSQYDGFRRLGSSRLGDPGDLFEGNHPLLRGHPPLAPQRLQELSMSDAMQPRPERRAALKGSQMTPCLQEGLLGQVFRRLGTAGEMLQVPVDAGVVLLDEPIASVRVTRAEP